LALNPVQWVAFCAALSGEGNEVKERGQGTRSRNEDRLDG
jgi:hypothetical protein